MSTRHQASHGALGSVRWEGNVRSLWVKDRVPAPVPTYRPGELRQVISPYTSIFLPVKQRRWSEGTLYTAECCAFNCTSTTGFDKRLLHHRNHWGCLRGGPPPCSVASGVGFHATLHCSTLLFREGKTQLFRGHAGKAGQAVAVRKHPRTQR